MTTPTEEIDAFIAEHGHGSARDALNVALARLDTTPPAQPDTPAERDAARAGVDFTEFIDLLWKDIIIKHHPDYGNWEYPGQAYRHLLLEFDDLRADLATVTAELAAALARFEVASDG